MKKCKYLLLSVLFAFYGINAQTIVLNEDFSAITDSNSYTITNSLDQYTQLPGWTGDWVYPSNGKVKLGKSQEGGYIQTPALDLSAANGQFVVTFDAKAWPNDATSIIVEVNNVPYTVEGLSTTSFNTFSLPFSCGTATTVIKFQSFQNSHGRFFIDNIIVVTPQEIVDTISPSLINVTASENSLQVTFSEIINSSTAENINNYNLDHNTMVTSAIMAGSNMVTLSVSPSLVDGITYTLQVNNIADTSGNVMQPNTFSFTYSNSVWDGSYAPWTHGTGTESDPFLIENAQQLAYLAYRVNNGLDAAGGHVSNHDLYYKLMTDINLNGSELFQWNPIGYWNTTTDYFCFGGHFDGNNHTVSGLFINKNANRVGFFGYTDDATIMNISVNGDTIAANGPYVGGIVGYANETTIKSCNNGCNIFSHNTNDCFSGGIIGYAQNNSPISVVNSNNTGNVFSHSINGEGYSGGVVGCVHNNSSLNIQNSYNLGNISSSYGYSGGIIGYVQNNSSLNIKIKNSYNIGNISNHYGYCSGGIIGHAQNYNISVINSYNIGNVSNYSNNSGGIVGYGSISVVNCYYLDDCANNNTYGGSPLSSAAMQTADFVNMLNSGSCAWEQDVSPYVNNGYPILTMIMDSAYTEPATDLTANSAILHGAISVEHATITSKGFEYRVLGDSTFTIVNVSSNDNSFSYLLNGLTPNTTYEYRTFMNVAECPYTSYGDIQSFEVSWLNADTILIYDADMLQWVSDRCNAGTTFEGKYIKLMNNIVLPLNQPNNMTSIGIYPNYPFKGTFDGNGMLISNLYIDQPNTEYQGFFGYALDANLYEVGLVNITASGRNYTGGMVAYASNTYMRDCYVSGGSLFALSYCGGLVGYQDQGTNSIISGCYNTCTVSGNHYVGGLVGFSNYATVRNSYVAANVTGQGNGIGAIIGGANEVLMYHCYFNDSITGQTCAIGENNFKDNEGMTTAQMQDPGFIATLNQGLVVPVWKSDYAVPINNGFPILIWQYSDVEACDAPENLNAVVNDNAATLSWAGGDNASYFIVEYGISDGETHSENTANHQLTLHNLQNANYFWRVKSVCSFGESNFVNGNTITVGIDDHDGLDFKVYPNPTSNIVNVQCSMHDTQAETLEIRLYDAYGRLLGVVETHGRASLQTAQIDLSQFADGFYFVKAVADGKTVAVRKVVKG
ncbi:MAG: T9SS type A sorting domain-containing protein [Bacteroidales bacterium]|nr:T9SS type A sorting domain-containing protein [Bacteroidales bacterium]